MCHVGQLAKDQLLSSVCRLQRVCIKNLKQLSQRNSATLQPAVAQKSHKVAQVSLDKRSSELPQITGNHYTASAALTLLYTPISIQVTSDFKSLSFVCWKSLRFLLRFSTGLLIFKTSQRPPIKCIPEFSRMGELGHSTQRFCPPLP